MSRRITLTVVGFRAESKWRSKRYVAPGAIGSVRMKYMNDSSSSGGSLGLKRVKELGGLTIAQDPDEAIARRVLDALVVTY